MQWPHCARYLPYGKLYCLAADCERGAAAVLSLLADELHRVTALLGEPTLASLRGAGVRTVSTERGWSTTAMPDA